MAYCTDPVKLPVKYMADSGDLLLERESWITRDSKVMDCVGKFDVTAFQLDGLRNRVRIKQLLWSDQNNFCVVTQLLFKTKNLSKTHDTSLKFNVQSFSSHGSSVSHQN